ncbi:immunity protein TriTu family protein [Chitiniphilus eburneus]|uniref:Uncharacterized protein n=1 Tax=Chitiniphilus eburneus TaxID=2571148 RepID=A0A4U0Q584_9NEIS|nr:hypothetical protein [Chitiniphilus eburneus]TJZ76333.1 hypothetical protein FAZ21_06055 [Chitiniphilus eburneus]
MDLNEFVAWWEENKKRYASIEKSEIIFSPKSVDDSLRLELDGNGTMGRATVWGRGDFVLEILAFEDGSDLYMASGFLEKRDEIEEKFADFFAVFAGE